MPTLEKQKQTSQLLASRPPDRNRPLWQHVLRYCIWCPIAILILLVALEGIFALAHIGEEEMVEPSPEVGFTHIPHKLITFRSEGYSQGRTNSLGLRDAERPLNKPAGVTRIAVLGDSMAEAFQVPIEQTFARLLERALNQHAAGRFEVLNFGMSSYSTVQELYQFKRQVERYRPDVCIVCYHIGDCEKNMYTPDADNFSPRPYCQLDAQGRLLTNWTVYDKWRASERPVINDATRWLCWHSRLWAVATQLDLDLSANPAYKQLRTRVNAIIASLIKRPGAAPSADRITFTASDILNQPQPAPALDAVTPAGFCPPATGLMDIVSASWWNTLAANRQRMRVTQAIFETLARECQSTNCRLVVAALPAPNNSMIFFKQLQFLKEQAKRDGFTFVDMNGAFPSLGPQQQSSSGLFYVVHFTAKGHTLMARGLERALFEHHIVERAADAATADRQASVVAGSEKF
jgi:lysophospholipase L1-like esterase